MSSITSSLGIGSGLDLSSLLDGLQSAEQQRLVPLQTRASSYNTKLSAYGTLQSTLAGFQTAAEKLGDAALFSGVKTASSSEAFKASAGNNAEPGSYSLEVFELARAQSLVTAGQASTTDTIGNGGTITLSVGDADGNVSESVDIDIDIAAQDSSLSGIRDAINAADIGVSASIVNDGSDTPYRLVLSSNATGTDSQITLSVAEDNEGSTGGGLLGGGDAPTPLADLLDYDSSSGEGQMTQTVAARNARIAVNGIDIQSQSNTVEDAIQGVTLTLSGTTAEPQTLTATRDTDSVKAALEGFVAAYNRVHALSEKLTAFDGEDKANGILLGDSTARAVETRVRSALNTPIAGGMFSGLAEIGVSLQRDGTMEIDDEALDDALANNLGGIGALLASEGGAVVGRAVAAMQEINESSRKISEIVGLIDDIAFQTNLLALNASVEAARAGEQGRGFAVVASEVRNLASRSAAAAKDIKALVEDSAAKVAGGSEQVALSGKTLDAIVENVHKVGDIIAEIAAASSEQSSGIEQVNLAVSQMDSMTQQNASLVEESAAASRSLEEQALALKRQVAFFQLDGDGGAAANPAPVVATQPDSASGRRAAPATTQVAARNEEMFIDDKEWATF